VAVPGGAGGGRIRVEAVRVAINGLVDADGDDGSPPPADDDDAGSGGGGSGGSVQVCGRGPARLRLCGAPRCGALHLRLLPYRRY
jgi:hypothetical protein